MAAVIQFQRSTTAGSPEFNFGANFLANSSKFRPSVSRGGKGPSWGWFLCNVTWMRERCVSETVLVEILLFLNVQRGINVLHTVS